MIKASESRVIQSRIMEREGVGEVVVSLMAPADCDYRVVASDGFSARYDNHAEASHRFRVYPLPRDYDIHDELRLECYYYSNSVSHLRQVFLLGEVLVERQGEYSLLAEAGSSTVLATDTDAIQMAYKLDERDRQIENGEHDDYCACGCGLERDDFGNGCVDNQHDHQWAEQEADREIERRHERGAC